jgi:DNA-binding beta-propeller fold protein YncE
MRRRVFVLAIILGIGVLLFLIYRPDGHRTAFGTGSSLSVCCSIPSGSRPTSVATNRVTHKTYVAHELPSSQTSMVTIINDLTDSIITTVPIGHNSANGSVAVNEQTNRIYVTNYEDSTFTIVGGSCDCVLNTVAAGTNGPRAVAVDETTNRYYIGSGPDHRVVAFDGTSDSPICSADMGSASDVTALQVNPNNHRVFITGQGIGAPFGTQRYSLMSGSNCGLLYNNVPLSCGGQGSRQLVYNSPDNRFYGIGFNTPDVVGYDGDTGAEEVCLALPGASDGGFGIGIDRAQQVIYATSKPGGAAYKLYRVPLPASASTVTSLQPGLTNLWEIGVDPIGCTSFIFVADDADNQVWGAQDGPTCKGGSPQLNITKLSQIAPPKSCYNVLTSSQTQLFQVCDNDWMGTPASNAICVPDGVCNDEDPAQGQIKVTISPGDYHVVESVAPPNHTIDTSKHDCDASSGTCAVTVIDTPNIRPWFPWDLVGVSGPCGGVDGKVTVSDILAVVQHFGSQKPFPGTPTPMNPPTATPTPVC